ncbi:aspartyl-tRNA(Asn)/glutamyl-tRNA(Gln) amidotransferase subunit A [Methylobacterium sp. 174MFSha1.1]|uniref:amidase n=1 Tax=Methylobacterium sp. 174MFSha1.1 TaxID=1502749 RepID=UPI0008E93A58|nr:amidase [Methylobacterium sp. 174MFSha1.1]SFU49443.1 aspartyl-tRNA(Asn)/glutamyl-tRNA(Gln) amidotransferase subunit A [Methylobacterium sp. 174MFSha1.1]
MSELHTLSVAEAGRLIGSRKVSPVELVEAMLARIAAVDDRLNSYLLVLAERALSTARTAEAEIMAGGWRGPLHGIPFGIKDNYHVAGLPTTGGSRLMQDSPPQPETATIVARLERAGAILMGKLNTWEYGTGDGQVYHDLPYPVARNPWDLARFTGGSSTGAGAAVAGGTALFALGSDTGGSIRLPAAACGLQGLKPTFGRNSRAACLPNCWSLDHTGALTWTVEDQAIVLGATAGFDPRDPSSATAPVPDYRRGLHEGVRGLVIGIVRDLDGVDPAIRAGIEDAGKRLAEAGAILREVSLPAPLSTYQAVAWTINWAESFSIHEQDFLARRGQMGRALRTKMGAGFCVRAVDYLAALRERRRLALATDALVRSVDALLIPGAFHVAPSLREPDTVPAFTRDTACAAFNLSGHPALSLCTGFDAGGLPLNAQIVGRTFDEATVLRVAQAYEAATPWRARKPDPAPHAPEPIMPDTTPPSVSPEHLAEAERYATRYGLDGLAPAEVAELALLLDKTAAAGLAIPRQSSKEDEPAHVFRVPLR